MSDPTVAGSTGAAAELTPLPLIMSQPTSGPPGAGLPGAPAPHVHPASAPAVTGSPGVACATCGQPTGIQGTTAAQAQGLGTDWPAASGPLLAVGRLRAHFPTLGLQREYAEAAGVDPDAIVTSRDLRDVLADSDNRYLARQVCWTFAVQSVDVCQVLPRHDAELDELIDALGPDNEGTVQVLIGEAASRNTFAGCWLPDLPGVATIQILSFGLNELVTSLGEQHDQRSQTTLDHVEEDPTGDVPPLSDTASGAGAGAAARTGDDPRWQSVIRETFLRLTQRSGATGFRDEDRARNYVALKDPAIYSLIWTALQDGKSLVEVSARRLTRAGRRMVAVRLAFRHRQTQVIERYERLVDTQDTFCFAVGALNPVYE
ncbi:cyanobactin maturation protease PatG family protein [Modestobacter sp. URMC 112]